MKLKVAIVLTMSIILALELAGIAAAQTPCESFTFTHGSALPGGSDTVCGTVPSNIDAVVLFFDNTIDLGIVYSDENHQFCLPFTVPTDATAGDHILGFLLGPVDSGCFTAYIVEAAVPAPPAEVPVPVAEVPVPVAAPAAEVPVAATLPTTLPSTGFMLIPAAGLLAGGLGTLLFRKRRR